MSLIVSVKTSSASPIEAGTYPAICYGIVDLGEQYSETYDKYSRKVALMWELPSEKHDFGEGEVSRTITKIYTCSLNDKAQLRKDLIAWRGRDFTDDELRAFDLRNIIGAPCLINIVNTERNGNKYADIAAIMKLSKGMKVDPQTMQSIIFDLDADDLAVIDALPPWIGDMIKKSKTYTERTTGKTEDGIDPTDFPLPTDDDEADEVPF